MAVKDKQAFPNIDTALAEALKSWILDLRRKTVERRKIQGHL